MVDFYVDKIQRGLMDVENVPSLWRKKVEDKLKEMQS